MILQRLLFATCALAGASAFAQSSMPTVGRVEGTVTASQGGNGRLLAPGSSLQDGTRVVSTSGGTATLQAGGGCSVSVPPGHGVTVRRGMDCQQLRAGVAPVIPEVAARKPNAPPAHVLDRLRANGASPVAIGVHEQLADDPPLSPR